MQEILNGTSFRLVIMFSFFFPCTRHGKLDEPWPGHPYTSHICQFDVFPRFDPVRTKFDGMTIKV